MQINFLEDIPKNKQKESSKKVIEDIKFSNPSQTNSLSKEDKKKDSSFFKDIFNYFKKNKAQKPKKSNSGLEKSRQEMLDIINKEKINNNKKLSDKPINPKHSRKYHKISKKIEKKENGSKSFLSSFFDFFKEKPKSIAPEFLPKEEKKKRKEKKVSDIQKVKKPKQKRIGGDFWEKISIFFENKKKIWENKKTEEKEKKDEKIISLKKEKPESEKKDVLEVDNPEVLESNLIKKDEDIAFDWGRNMGFLAISVILSMAIVGFSYWTLGLWADKKIEESSIASEEVKVLGEKVKLARKNAGEAIEFRDRVKLINSMLGNHIYWSNFFDFLEKNTLKEVYYSGGFSGDIKGEYSLSANTKNYGLIEAQIEQFYKSPYVVRAGAGGGQLFVDRENDATSVKFDLDLLIKPSLFVEIND